ncbi:MAG: hypothetical protein BMS9Abin28_1662 [Anaerolineae bacterium]|nr:MAG: hypothetical protein BMS9Abin28_1662 [Anaerolineae bacterium]
MDSRILVLAVGSLGFGILGGCLADAPTVQTGAEIAITLPPQVSATDVGQNAELELTAAVLPSALPRSPTESDANSEVEQGDSGGVTLEEDSQRLPFPPSGLLVEWIDSRTLGISWLGTGSDVISHYLILQQTKDSNDWKEAGEVMASGDNIERYDFTHEVEADADVALIAVVAVDIYGNESPLSETVTVPSP